MTTDEQPLGPIPEELRTFYESEREFPRLSSSSLDHLHGRIAGAKAASALIGTKLAVVAAISFAAGGVSGALTHAALTVPDVITREVVRVETPQVVQPHEEPLDLRPLEPQTHRPSDIDNTNAVEPATRREVPTAHAERRLLDAARASLARGRYEDALHALASHEQRYPSGLIVEEREVLAIEVLIARDRMPQARERAARFQANFPTSLYQARVRRLLDDSRSAAP